MSDDGVKHEHVDDDAVDDETRRRRLKKASLPGKWGEDEEKEEEDASLLHLGRDFNDDDKKRDAEDRAKGRKPRGPVVALFNGEVKIALEQRQSGHENTDHELNPVCLQALHYTQRFNKFSNTEAVQKARELLQKANIDGFMLAALINLSPDSAEEARALIPKLSERFHDAELQQILDDLNNLRET